VTWTRLRPEPRGPMKTLRVLAAALTATALLTGCGTTASPSATSVAATPATPSQTLYAIAACSYDDSSGGYGAVEAVFDSLDAVKDSFATKQHPKKVGGFLDAIKHAEDVEDGDDCSGHVQLLAFGSVAAELNLAVVEDPGHMADLTCYRRVADAGNRWLDWIALTDKRFSTRD